MSGAIAALGDTLFPPESIAEGLAQDISPSAHLFVRLRILHPTIAVIVGVYLLALTTLERSGDFDQGLSWSTGLLRGLVIIQLLAGAVNVFILAPVWMQLIHLLLADFVWIVLVVFGFAGISGKQ